MVIADAAPVALGMWLTRFDETPNFPTVHPTMGNELTPTVDEMMRPYAVGDEGVF